MSDLTAKLLGSRRKRQSRSIWVARFGTIADRLVEAYGIPHLGNLRDPVREIFYILLSAKTTDGQYRRTFQALSNKFPTVAEMARAKTNEILACIASGGLANKKASQIKRTAALLAKGDERPADRLRKMSAQEAFDFLTHLPGMGPKSAFCVMMYSLDVDVFPVDANVQRVAERLGVIPAGLKHYQAQQRLPPLIPAGRSRELHIAMVVHGRETCFPRNPKCGSCTIREFCRYGMRALDAEGASRGKE